MSQTANSPSKSKPDDHPQAGQEVIIKIDNVDVRIHRGNQTVAEIKAAGKIPQADDLEQVVDGKLVLLPDSGHVVIKGGEVFVSHPKDSGSSSH